MSRKFKRPDFMKNEDDEDQQLNDQEDQEGEEFEDEDLTTPLDLTLDHRVVEVLLRKEGTEQPWECELRELSAFRRDVYLDKLRPHFAKGGMEVKIFKDIQTSLLGETLYDKESQKVVPIEEIRKFPASTVNQLYVRAAKMNDLDKDAEKRAKKLLSRMN